MTRPLKALPFSLILFAWAVSLFAAEPARPKPPSYVEIPELLEQLEVSNIAAFAASKRLELAPEKAFDGLMQKLKSKKPFARWWAASLLAKTGDERALEPIAELCRNDPDVTVRSVAVWALRRFDSERAWKAIVGALSDPAPTVRGWAMQAIEKGAYRKALPEVRKLLKHPNPKTRYDAMVTTFFLLEKGHLAFVKGILESEMDANILTGALSCLTRLPQMTPDVLDVMISQLDSPYEKVREAANKLLVKGAGMDFGFKADASPRERAAAARKWRDWYSLTKGKLKWNPNKRRFEVPGAKKDPSAAEGAEKRAAESPSERK